MRCLDREKVKEQRRFCDWFDVDCCDWLAEMCVYQELLGVEEEKDSADEEGQDHDESSEYEEYSDSDEEDTGPRLKPVFVRRYNTR